MTHKLLLKEMKEIVNNRDPVEFFSKMVDVFALLFDRLEVLEQDLARVKTHSALAIQWEPKVASAMLAKQVEILRQDKETYFDELSALKQAFAEGIITQNYQSFCQFWLDTLGWHPFLDYSE